MITSRKGVALTFSLLCWPTIPNELPRYEIFKTRSNVNMTFLEAELGVKAEKQLAFHIFKASYSLCCEHFTTKLDFSSNYQVT